MAQGDQVKNGKAFEYALAKQYCDFINSKGVKAEVVNDDACCVAKGYYEEFNSVERSKFDKAAFQTIDTMVRIEPGLLAA